MLVDEAPLLYSFQWALPKKGINRIPSMIQVMQFIGKQILGKQMILTPNSLVFGWYLEVCC